MDILKADQDRYGRNDLICAVGYHNLGVTSLLGGDVEAALNYFQVSVILKRACLEKNDMTIAVCTHLSAYLYHLLIASLNSILLLCFSHTLSNNEFISTRHLIQNRTHLLRLVS